MTGPLRSARQLWRRLISMRTALVLLFLLALAAVPGSLLPQRPLNPPKVQAYLASHGAWGRFLDRIGAFDVFGSIWFSAVYLLLFISLIGCLVPRITVYARALRAKPIKAPRNLDRLAEHGRLVSTLPPAGVAQRLGTLLRPRWRTIVRPEDRGVLALSAEKGYSREAGNLLFHVSLLVALVLIAGGKLLSYQGSIVTTEGTGFCNRPISYDTFHAGRWVNAGRIAGFCIDNLNSFTASYRQDGSPAQFRADVSYSRSLGAASQRDVITVNHPLRMDGDRVYLINHGFSPTVTVTRPGRAPITDTEAFLPKDEYYTSEGAFSFPGRDSAVGDDIGLSAVFAPTPVDNGGVISSIAPSADHPVLAVLAYTGLLNPDGQPQSVYTLNQSQIGNGGLKRVAAQNLQVGQSMRLPDGTQVRFDGYRQWATFQVSHDPTQTLLLVAAVLMVLGLLGSLAVRRRRLWIRITPAEDGLRSLVAVGGLARNDSGNFTAEFEQILATLRRELSSPDPEPVPDVEAPAADRIGAGKD
ncbi:MAG TPA: cytochrome c biogenesis protein ResB [Jatrophihabitans sp.]|nr:cytochrome c biogenesis protein ResB [Jatrophihabitans sp.]